MPADAASAITGRALQPALCGARGRRQFRQRAARRQRRRAAPSGLAHQDHDALPAVRADRGRQAAARFPARSFRARRAAGALQARPAAGPDHLGRGRDPRAGDQVGQRRGGRGRRSDRRRRRDLRPHDDAQGARARHEPHGLQQRVRPARRGAAHHRARSGRRSAAPSRIASRATTAISRRRASSIAATRCAITTSCSAASRASTASRPATPARRASISCPRCGAATATSSRSCSAARSGGARDARMRAWSSSTSPSASRPRAPSPRSPRATESRPSRPSRSAPSDLASPTPPAKAVALAAPKPRPSALARADAMAPVAVVEPRRAETAGAAVAPSAVRRQQSATVLSRTPKPGSGEPINPVKVKTITVKAGNVQTADAGPARRARAAGDRRAAALRRERASGAPLAPPPGARPGVLGVLPVEPPTGQRRAALSGRGGLLSAASQSPRPHPRSTAPRQPHPRGPWMIQVGAFPKEAEAKDRLREAQTLGKTVRRQGRAVHRTGHQGQPGTLSRPLRRLRPGRRRSRLQVLQAQRHRLHGDQELERQTSAQVSNAPGPRPGAFCFRRAPSIERRPVPR